MEALAEPQLTVMFQLPLADIQLRLSRPAASVVRLKLPGDPGPLVLTPQVAPGLVAALSVTVEPLTVTEFKLIELPPDEEV